MTYDNFRALRAATAAMAAGLVLSTVQFAAAAHVDNDGAHNNGHGNNRFGDARPTPEGFVDGQKYDDQSNPRYDGSGGENDFDGNNGAGDDKNRDPATGLKTNGNNR